MSKRQQQKADTRHRLLAEAKRLFIEQGYEPTTTRQLARVCDVSVGTVFSHFPDKPTLLRAILYNDVESALAWAREEVPKSSGGLEVLLIHARHLYRFYASNPTLSRALLTTSMFDMSGFGSQLTGFMSELSRRLTGVDGLTEERAYWVSRAWMASYFFVLVEGLGGEEMDVEDWLRLLRGQCEVVGLGAG
ncbi:TetR/AcrR family transcriptional regulator [Saccharospirillum salsuginis]|uniref:TetR family transcriptional regulator n=1 Tax=Saccharospirillum salsuginis TaxID=418750 RepID=A0A918KDT6_9GAMM|nr:TetR/AcrR family transcriptional regulator [Saccharospirillum salsuginis]GGX59203.1 TetR family transcriptional regulator [Saccharospirillum salsuginis]